MKLDEKEFMVTKLVSGQIINPAEVVRLPSGNIRASFIDGNHKVSTTFHPSTFAELLAPAEYRLANVEGAK